MAQADNNTRELTYTDVAWTGSWRQRAAGMWAAGLVGLVGGAIGGAIAPLLPVLAFAYPLSEAAPLILPSIATFASAGLVSLAAAGALVGLGSGGAAAVAEEQEKRDKSRIKAMGINLPEPEKSTETTPKNLFERIASYINPRAGMIFIAMGMVAGAVFAWAAAPAVEAFATAGAPAASGAGITSAVISGTGIASVIKSTLTAGGSAIAATAAYCVGVMGMFGAMFGVRYAHLTNDLRNVMAGFLSTKFGDKDKAPEQAPQLQMQPVRELQTPVIDVQVEQVPSHMAKLETRLQQGFQKMLEKPEPDCGCSHIR
ncbi:MAG: hypothetical protein EBR02_01625 [Alphaproteobacteria bacterium]|nr:hypothetical protein [Alphaproteobacteria bacterium]